MARKRCSQQKFEGLHKREKSEPKSKSAELDGDFAMKLEVTRNFLVFLCGKFGEMEMRCSLPKVLKVAHYQFSGNAKQIFMFE